MKQQQFLSKGNCENLGKLSGSWPSCRCEEIAHQRAGRFIAHLCNLTKDKRYQESSKVVADSRFTEGTI